MGERILGSYCGWRSCSVDPGSTTRESCGNEAELVIANRVGEDSRNGKSG